MKKSTGFFSLYDKNGVQEAEGMKDNTVEKMEEKKPEMTEKSPVVTCGADGSDFPGFDQGAIQNAVNRVAAAGGGTVLLSAGTYLLRDAIHMKSHVTLQGSGVGETVLYKLPSVKTTTEGFCGYGHKEILVTDGSLFAPGDGVYLTGDQACGFQATQTTVTLVEGNTVFLADPLNADLLKHKNGTIETIYPLIKAVNCEDIHIRHMSLEGNARANGLLGGCRGGAVFLIGSRDVWAEHLQIRDFNGEGFSYQQCSNIRLSDSELSCNCGNGVHPGSGTVGMLVQNCEIHHNKRAGIFYCLRVCYHICCGNRIYANEMEGLTIGHRDDHIEIFENEIFENGREGIYFRPENYPGMSGRYVSIHHNRIRENGREKALPQIHGPAAVTALEVYDNQVGGPESFVCGDTLYDSFLWNNRMEGAVRIGQREAEQERLRWGAQPDKVRKIDLDQIPVEEYRHL